METAGTRVFFGTLLVAAVVLTVLRPQSTLAPREEGTVISFAFWGTYQEWETWRDVVNSFHDKNPGITVRLNYIPSQYDDKIRLLLAADSAPDVMLIQDEPFPAYAGYGKFADLTDRINEPNSPIDWNNDLWPTALQSFKHKGRQKGIPVTGGNCLVYYNRKVFRDLGVPFPDDEHWTIDDFIETGKQLTRDTNGDGKLDTFGFSLPIWTYFMPWTWALGANYLNDTCTDWAFTGPEAVASLRLYQDVRYRLHITPSPFELPNTAEGAMFMTGHIAMFCGGPWSAPGFEAAGIDFDIAHVPIGPTGIRQTRVTWDGLCMFDKSEHKDVAWRFILHCLSPEAQNLIARSVLNLPTLRSAKDSFVDPNNGRSEEKFFDAFAYSRIQPISRKWDEMNNVLTAVYEMVSLNRITPEDAIDRIAADIRRDRIFPIEDRE